MLKSTLCLVLGVLVGSCAAPANVPRAPTKTETADALAAETVALVRRNEDGQAGPYCSGVWVSESSILTASHCVEDEPGPLEYAVRSDVFAPATLHERSEVGGHAAFTYASDPDHDLALLRAVNAPPHEVARVSLEGIRPGAFVQVMGHPRGMWWSYSSGDVAALRQVVAGIDIVWIQATAPISPGNSGGGLFDARGFLVGLCSRGEPPFRAQNINLFVHAQYIDAFVRKQGVAL